MINHISRHNIFYNKRHCLSIPIIQIADNVRYFNKKECPALIGWAIFTHLRQLLPVWSANSSYFLHCTTTGIQRAFDHHANCERSHTTNQHTGTYNRKNYICNFVTVFALFSAFS